METSLATERQIKRMPDKKRKATEALPKDQREKLEGLIDAIEWAGLDEFMEYIRSPWRMLWPNFVAGIARWFWALVGVAIVITLVWWIISTMISLPLIGKKLEPYAEKVQYEFTKYTEATNYKEDYARMESLLRDIKTELQNSTK